MQVQTATPKFGSSNQRTELHRFTTSSKYANEKLSCISNKSEFSALESAWRQLEAESIITPTVFQSFEWAKSYCENYTDCELFILAGYEGSRLVFLFPLMIVPMHGLRTLQWLTEPLGQYGDVMCAKGQDVSQWLGLAFEYIKSHAKTDLVRLRHVRADSLAQPYVKISMVDAKYDERAPFLDLTTFKTENEYDARYTSTQRKRRKKIRKNLEEMGSVNFDILSTGPNTDIAISSSISEKNAWLAERGRYNRIMGCPHHVAFLKTLTRAKSGTFEAVISELKAGTNPVSWEIGFRYRGTHFAYITSHAHKLTDLSPGRLHMDMSQRDALAAGQKRFDLMVPYDLHKESWSSGMMDANDYYLPMSALGRLYGASYLRTIRPLVRKIYYKLPASALRLLQTCFFCKRP